MNITWGNRNIMFISGPLNLQWHEYSRHLVHFTFLPRAGLTRILIGRLWSKPRDYVTSEKPWLFLWVPQNSESLEHCNCLYQYNQHSTRTSNKIKPAASPSLSRSTNRSMAESEQNGGGLRRRLRPNVLVTGTPGTGKTTTSSLLADATGMHHFNISDLSREKGLHDGWDDELDCHVINEDLVRFYIFLFWDFRVCMEEG